MKAAKTPRGLSRREKATKPAGRKPAARPRLATPSIPQGPAIDIIVDSPLWQAERGIKSMLQRAIAVAAASAGTSGGELAIVLTDDSAIRTLNRDWRGKDQPTNVLSFPAPSPDPPRRRARVGGRAQHSKRGSEPSRLLGDIVIAYETLAREAGAAEKPLRHHLAHLAVHGFLHLVGHDHIVDAEAEAMEAIEIAALARLKVPDPYRPPSPPGPRLRRGGARGA